MKEEKSTLESTLMTRKISKFKEKVRNVLDRERKNKVQEKK